jgi:hypothetical protein
MPKEKKLIRGKYTLEELEAAVKEAMGEKGIHTLREGETLITILGNRVTIVNKKIVVLTLEEFSESEFLKNFKVKS